MASLNQRFLRSIKDDFIDRLTFWPDQAFLSNVQVKLSLGLDSYHYAMSISSIK